MFYDRIELGLENMSIACNALDNPQNKLNIIHIAGTNGKGSVGQFITENLIHQGYKVGHFSSPAVIDKYDIWQIINKNITEYDYNRLYKKALNACSQATQFEIETLIAFMYFNENNCDYAVIETGLGGKFDATNIVDKKLLCVITTIDMDHTAFLGNTIYEIATQKAGIIKNNACVSAIQVEDAKRALTDVCDNITFTKKAKNIRYFDNKTIFDYDEYKNIEIPLLGSYQVDNAVLAIESLKSIGKFNIDGFKNTVWHCRFEKIKNFILDGAHNINGINALERNINIYLKDKDITFITGIFKDKDYKAIAPIAKYANKIYTVQSDNPRCLSAMQWADELKKYNTNVTAIDNIKKAINMCLNDEVVLIFGSLSIMAEAYKEVIYSV